MNLTETMKGVCISCEGRENSVAVGLKGSGRGIIVGIATLAHSASEHLGIPLEAIALAVLELQEIGSLGESVTIDLNRLPPDLAEKLKQS